MTDEERKAWDRFVSSYCDPRIIQQSKSVPADLAADAELKRLREEYEAIYTDRNLFIECVHEKAVEIDRLREENKRLREAVEWACENAPAGENVYVSAIRRRAKEG